MLMRKTVGREMGIKAAGGIKTAEDVIKDAGSGSNKDRDLVICRYHVIMQARAGSRPR